MLKATRAYEETGIQVFGFAIDVNANSTSSLAWGGSREYEKLREHYKSSVETQLRDYEGMFKVAEMDQRLVAASGALIPSGIALCESSANFCEVI